MEITLLQIVCLAVVQGLAELLPVSSSAHVIVLERWMGLDPSDPKMTFLLVMLHTGTMGAVLVLFWSRWKKLKLEFFKMVFLATAVTGGLGLALKKLIEKIIMERMMGESGAEIESLFKSLPLIAFSLAMAGVVIFVAGRRNTKYQVKAISPRIAIRVGWVQGLCLPFRGFSRSGATISAALLSGVPRRLAEDFSFALAVLLTPPVIALELYRLLKASRQIGAVSSDLSQSSFSLSDQLFGHLLMPGMIGMVLSFCAGILALKWLSKWLESGRWSYFGIYCWVASAVVAGIAMCGK